MRPEWGTALAAAASAGAASLSLTGLGVGTLRAGTTFRLDHNGNIQTYTLIEDAEPTAGAATVQIAPVLVAPVVANTAVVPDARKKSLFNKRTGRLFFTDGDLQDHARRAMSVKGRVIRQADDADLMLFRATRYYAWTGMLSSDEYLAAVLMNDERGTAAKLIEAKRAVLAEDAAIVFDEETGAGLVYINR